VRIALIAVLAASLAACGMKTDTPEDKAATMAMLFNKTKGLTAGEAADDLSARADGKFMVLTFKNAMEDAEVTPEEAKEGITPLICGDENYTNILEQGVGIRVEMFTNSGKAIPPVSIESCPKEASPAAAS
jgi:hypothetical protein